MTPRVEFTKISHFTTVYMNDDELDFLIRRSHPQPEFPASFEREIWARIAVAEQQSWLARWRQWRQAVLLWIARPVPALALGAIMLIVGVGLGNLSRREDEAAAMRAVYVASINPFPEDHGIMQK